MNCGSQKVRCNQSARFFGFFLAACFTVQGLLLAQETDEKPSQTLDASALSKVPTNDAFFPNFRSVDVAIDDINVHAVVGGQGPPLLLLHGAPQSHVMWRDVAPQLAKHFTVVASDLRGYGRSGKPAKGDYSKRRMAKDQVELMKHLGFEKFRVAAHDRGAHAARRMAKDHPKIVERLAIIDIVPSSYVYANVKPGVGKRYWAWFLFAQKAPLPEKMMGPQAAEFTRMCVTISGGEFDSPAADDYAATNGTSEAFHGMCEDYRASATVDIEHDQADADQLIECETLVIWGKKSNSVPFDMRAIWRKEAKDVAFFELDCSHFVVEEKPKETLEALLPFMLGEKAESNGK